MATADSRGAFEIRGLPRDSVVMKASAAGFRTSNEEINLKGTRASAERDIFLEKGARVAGIVRDPTGEAVVGAVVTVLMGWDTSFEDYWRIGIGSGRALKTDENGAFTIDGITVETWANYRVTAFHPVRGSAVSDPLKFKVIDEELRTVLTVFDHGIIEGDVKDDEQMAVSGVKLKLQRSDPLKIEKQEQEVETDNSGHYRFDGLAEGDYVVRIDAEGFSASTRHGIQIRRTKATTNLEFILERGRPLRFTVKGPDEKPVSAARISIRSRKGGSAGGQTDIEGVLALQNAPDGPYQLNVTASGFANYSDRSVEVDSAGEITVTLKARAQVTGQVLNAVTREPIDSFHVVLGQEQTNQNRRHRNASQSYDERAEGKFELGADDGQYRVTVNAEGFTPYVSDVIDVANAISPPPLEILLSPGCFLEGYVRGIDGTPIAAADIYYRNSFDLNSGFFGGTRTEADGYFYLPDLSPGSIDVALSASGRFPIRVVEQVIVTHDRRNWLEETLVSECTLKLHWSLDPRIPTNSRRRAHIQFTMFSTNEQQLLSWSSQSSPIKGKSYLILQPSISWGEYAHQPERTFPHFPCGEYRLVATWMGRKFETTFSLHPGSSKEISISFTSSETSESPSTVPGHR
jgi:hypothetical protein